MLKVENLTFRYSGRKPSVLDNFSMEICMGKAISGVNNN